MKKRRNLEKVKALILESLNVNDLVKVDLININCTVCLMILGSKHFVFLREKLKWEIFFAAEGVFNRAKLKIFIKFLF